MLCGEDPELLAWLTDHNIRTRPFAMETPTAREVILVSGSIAEPQRDVFCELARRMARGATVIFLTPEVFQRGDQPVGWLPLANKGTLAAIHGWLYLKDEWSKRHPIFDGLPVGRPDGLCLLSRTHSRRGLVGAGATRRGRGRRHQGVARLRRQG